MDTQHNRLAVLASFLRTAAQNLRSRRVDPVAEELRANALESIGNVAEELERLAGIAASDPAQTTLLP